MDPFTIIPIILLVTALMAYTYKKDKYMKEPLGNLFKAFAYGLLSFPCFFFLLFLFIPFFSEGDDAGFIQTILSIFCISAVPMEGAKLLFLWLLLRKNNYFNEHVDGIIYATFISLGFASLESLTFLSTEEGDAIEQTIGITRGLLSAPVNWFYGILMGYYYSLAKFSKTNKTKYALLAFIVPVVVHAAYDLLMSSAAYMEPLYEGIAFIVLLFLGYQAWKLGNKRIDQLLERDKPYFENEEEEGESNKPK